MARKGKQYVFSARTTEEGLKKLGELRQERRVGWDELVVEAVSEHYGLDKAMMTLPKKEAPAKEAQPEQPPATEQTAPAEGKRRAKKSGKKANEATN